MIKKIIFAGVGAIMVLALAACGAPHQGVVHDKRYSPPSSYTVYDCYSRDKNGVCTFQVPRQQPIGPSWSLDIYNGDDHGWVDVNEGIYDSVQVGDSVNLDK